jgi:hypothetical protein
MKPKIGHLASPHKFTRSKQSSFIDWEGGGGNENTIIGFILPSGQIYSVELKIEMQIKLISAVVKQQGSRIPHATEINSEAMKPKMITRSQEHSRRTTRHGCRN